MTIQHRQKPEEITAGHLVKFIASMPSAEYVEELLVTLNGQQVRMDVCSRRPSEETGEIQYTAWEVKERLTYKVVEQAKRWLGRVHRVYVVVNEPLQISQPHAYRLGELRKAGIGVVYVTAAGTVIPAPFDHIAMSAKFNTHPDIRIIEHTFNRPGVQDRELAPAAGTTGLPTVTKARGYWSDATEWVRDHPGGKRKELILDLPQYEDDSAHKMRKAIKSGEWRGVRRQEIGGELHFWPKETK